MDEVEVTDRVKPQAGAAPQGSGRFPASSAVAARLRLRLRFRTPEILLYCAVRVVGLIVLAVMAHHADFLPWLGKWDGVWYLGIARHGYDTSFVTHGSTLVNTNIVFFPLYPMLIKALSLVLHPLYAAVAISWVSGIVAAVAISAVGELRYDRRTGLVLAALWGIFPTAIVESMAYTESLFTALVAVALLLALRRRWVAAGAVSLLAGMTHPYGIALAAAVAIPAFIEYVSGARGEDGRRDRRPIVGAVIAPLGFVGYLAWTALETGHWDGWVVMEQDGWDNRPNPGGTLHEVIQILTKHQLFGYYVALAVVVLAVVSAMLLLREQRTRPDRTALPLVLFACFALLMALNTGPVYFHASARFLLPAFPLLLPAAVRLAKLDRRILVPAIGCGALASAWYGGYLLTVWPHSP